MNLGKSDGEGKAEKLGIELVFLPPYSPDFNPIEQVGRRVKRKITTTFFETKEEFLGLIKNALGKLLDKISYVKKWIDKFIPRELNQLC